MLIFVIFYNFYISIFSLISILFIYIFSHISIVWVDLLQGKTFESTIKLEFVFRFQQHSVFENAWLLIEYVHG